MIVNFSEPQIVTNPKCCSDPTAMCEKCARAALGFEDVDDYHRAMEKRYANQQHEEDHLPLPSMNFKRDEHREEKPQQTHNSQEHLPLPQMRFPRKS